MARNEEVTMSKARLHLWVIGILVTSVLVWNQAARADSHQWRFNELYSNEDGTIQFIEMKECCGFTAEWNLAPKWILAVNADHQYTFRSDLTGDTANRHLLLATAGFAALEGVPTPDAIIPDGFLPIGGDVLEYWMYGSIPKRLYGALPLDGFSALQIGGPGPDGQGGTEDDVTTIDVNSPTNYAGESGSIGPVPVRPTTWGAIKRLALDQGR